MCVCVCGGGRGETVYTDPAVVPRTPVTQTTGEVKGKETGMPANHFVIRRQNKTTTKKCLSDQCGRLPELTRTFFLPSCHRVRANGQRCGGELIIFDDVER